MSTISKKILEIKNKILECEKKYGREPGSVSLLAVSKQQSIDSILQAVEAGQFAFGENYLQEALPKIFFFADKNLEWHFIGPIQSNKTKKIAENFSWVHSLASIKIAKRLNNQRPLHLPPINICIEINVSQEPAKSGVNFNEIWNLINYCENLPRLKLRGLMAIPSQKNNVDEQRAEFQKLAILYKKLREKGYMLDTLSMGMSYDWEAAIAEGATMIRIGTAIFGMRN